MTPVRIVRNRPKPYEFARAIPYEIERVSIDTLKFGRLGLSDGELSGRNPMSHRLLELLLAAALASDALVLLAVALAVLLS